MSDYLNKSAMTPLKTSILSSQNFYRLVLLAIALRLLIMPFFGHIDLLSEIRRIYYWDQAGIYFDNISRNITAIFQLLFFKVFSVFIDNKEMLFSHNDMASSTATQQAYYEFVNQPTVLRALFIVKIPYLVADLISAWAIYQYCERSKGGQNAVLFWLFNPITIFAFYIFGRFESIPIMFCLLSLLALKRQQLLLAAIMISLSINSRELFIFYGPLFIALVCSPSCRYFAVWRRSLAVLVVLVAVAIAMELISLTGSELDSFGREVFSIATESRVKYLFEFKLGSFLFFPLFYFAVLMFSWNSDDNLSHKALLGYAFILMAFFCFSSHTAHYTSWMMAFPCIFLAYSKDFFKPMLLLCATWFVFNLSITDMGVFTTFLASPISLNMSGLPNFPALYRAFGIDNLLSLVIFQRLCRTLYCGSIIYMAIQMLLLYIRQRKLTEHNSEGQ